jgi:hypothetical protein
LTNGLSFMGRGFNQVWRLGWRRLRSSGPRTRRSRSCSPGDRGAFRWWFRRHERGSAAAKDAASAAWLGRGHSLASVRTRQPDDPGAATRRGRMPSGPRPTRAARAQPRRRPHLDEVSRPWRSSRKRRRLSTCDNDQRRSEPQNPCPTPTDGDLVRPPGTESPSFAARAR